MSYLDYQVAQVPTGFRKVLYINWPLVLLITAVCCIGFLMLYSVAGGRMDTWAEPQMIRFAVGMVIMLGLAFVPMWFWRGISVAAYVMCFLMLVAVDLFGVIGMGAQRWIDIGPIRVFSDGRDPEINDEVFPLPRRERRILVVRAPESDVGHGGDRERHPGERRRRPHRAPSPPVVAPLR